jgi:hypothetical protein
VGSPSCQGYTFEVVPPDSKSIETLTGLSGNEPDF